MTNTYNPGDYQTNIAEEAQDVHTLATTGLTASNPSVATDGTATPSSTQVGGQDGSGNLQPLQVDASKYLDVDIKAGTVNATNPSVGTDNTTAPTSETLIGGVDGSGNLQEFEVDASENLKTADVNSAADKTDLDTIANQTSGLATQTTSAAIKSDADSILTQDTTTATQTTTTATNTGNIKTDDDTLVTQTSNIAKESGGHLATIDTSTAEVAQDTDTLIALKDTFGTPTAITAATTFSGVPTVSQLAASSYVSFANPSDQATFLAEINVPSAFIGTLAFYGLEPDGTTLQNVNAHLRGSSTIGMSDAISTASALNHLWAGSAADFKTIYVVCTAFTSGSATATIGYSAAPYALAILNTITSLLQVVAGTALLADQGNTELRTSLYGKNSTAGDTALSVNSAGYLTENVPNTEVNQQVTSATTIFTQDCVSPTTLRYVNLQLLAPVAWGGVTVVFEGSNDSATWVSVQLVNSSSGGSGPQANTSGTGVFNGPIPYRYFRARTSAYTSGTVQCIAEFSAQPAQPLNVQIPVTQSGTWTVQPGNTPNTSPWLVDIHATGAALADTTTNPTTSLVGSLQEKYNGASWDRVRTPAKQFTVQATASGNTTVWTPTSGKKFRLMRFFAELTENVSQTVGGVLTLQFQDATTNMPIAFDIYVPMTAVTTAVGTGFSSGWIDLDNGILSAAANNALNINLSAALITGNARIIATGTEE